MIYGSCYLIWMFDVIKTLKRYLLIFLNKLMEKY